MSNGITARLFKGDRIIWCIFFTLCILSLIEVFSASSRQTYDKSYWIPITRHAIFIISGVFITWFIHTMKASWIKSSTRGVYIIGIAMLVYALVGGGAELNSSLRWIEIFGYKFQHFEVVKLGVVMFISLILAKAQKEEGTRLTWDESMELISRSLRGDGRRGDYTMLLILCTALLPCIFIITENLSTVAIILVVSFTMMFVGRVNWKHLTTLITIGVVGIGIGIGTLLSLPDSVKDYGKIGSKLITWRNRIANIANSDAPKRPEEVKISGNEQYIYSKVAIAEGGLLGRGPGNSVRRDFIPHANNDYIFAIILEELGLIGGVFTIILYLTLLYRCGIIAKDCEDPYSTFLVIGIGILIAFQAFMHMTISVSSIVTGQPLPLISQGGTSFIINCTYIGIVLCISRYVNKQENKPATNMQ
ncbi:MAG: FtsW/RodA/SpoVE family cell cycle protein [Bacteroidaceae bacterium]|nr:FtsW/RodA/SpoVE family cell cycle protein [Bacteroidaceae bacterium]